MKVLDNDSAIESLCDQLGLPSITIKDNRSTFLAYFVRRACSVYCPIPRGRLIRIITDLLDDLLEQNSEQLKEEVKNTLESLFTAGDLLELSRFKSFENEYSGDWIFTAQPSYHVRTSGRVYICGIPEGDVPFLPLKFREAMESMGPYRYIPTSTSEDLLQLESLGLRNLPEALWNPQPKLQTAAQFMETISAKLNKATNPGVMKDILILGDNHSPQGNYKTRWQGQKKQSGYFVCRRPRGYGALGWIYAELNEGTVIRFIDLPLSGNFQRGCDIGWQIQLAKDALSGSPNVYKSQSVGNKVKVKFSFPIPLWAQRRFRLIDDHANKSPFEHIFSLEEWPFEKSYIENHLWFQHSL